MQLPRALTRQCEETEYSSQRQTQEEDDGAPLEMGGIDKQPLEDDLNLNPNGE